MTLPMLHPDEMPCEHEWLDCEDGCGHTWCKFCGTEGVPAPRDSNHFKLPPEGEESVLIMPPDFSKPPDVNPQRPPEES